MILSLTADGGDCPLGAGQGTFKVAAVLVSGFSTGEQNPVVPDRGLAGRRLVERMVMGGALVILGCCVRLGCPVCVENRCWIAGLIPVELTELIQDRLDQGLLVSALGRRNSQKTGQAKGSGLAAGAVMDLSHGAALAEGLT